MLQAAAVSILYNALVAKKMEFCRLNMVLASKQLFEMKERAAECAERIQVLDELLADLYENEHDVSEEIAALQDEQAQEEVMHKQLVAAIRQRKAIVRQLVDRQTRLDGFRKSIVHRQRRLVERAFRMQNGCKNAAELLAQSV
ncbi:unnamed protein product [Aphanomyces euteiches]|uniref:Uncharacterized protein n=1 Tax=Aphanomyces euteiches TaxID=100861 RepID=A0A6G0W5Y5_9STRA|nr:hypothetical protein Ae201684_018425 [Aphanomyces euteiches]KAH9076010.1 hypothetical protein Ae201684P_012500 [Aphanomyces euteiches]KAH9110218.1 hypothetical protein AeMF1_014914 [Aphanomyces euteiches]KAH9130616.1 hypothetical protein LEN26_008357 [Aphanomyces euteiches]KAH9146781.1 hypothetical protein AeRB84_009365 [Aphanomyces euteiches]